MLLIIFYVSLSRVRSMGNSFNALKPLFQPLMSPLNLITTCGLSVCSKCCHMGLTQLALSRCHLVRASRISDVFQLLLVSADWLSCGPTPGGVRVARSSGVSALCWGPA